MKKYVLGIFAVLLAIGFSAFTPSSSKSNRDSLHWYDLSGNPLGFGEEPSTECTQMGVGCAKGFIEIPADPQTDIPDQTRKVNE